MSARHLLLALLPWAACTPGGSPHGDDPTAVPGSTGVPLDLPAPSTTDALPTTGGTSSTAESTAAADTTDAAGTTSAPVDLPHLDDTWCGVFDPARVYLIGTFEESHDYAKEFAILDPAVPDAPCVGFSEDPKITHIRPNDGRLFWKGSFIPGVLGFTADELRWHKFKGVWDYPNFPEDNEDPLTTDQCPDGVTEFFVRPGDSSLVYGCPDELDAMIYHDEAGALVYAAAADDPARHLVAAAADGVFLTRAAADDTVATLRLLPVGEQATIPVTPPLEAAPNDRMIQARARPDDPHALWAVVTKGDNAFKRWTITTAGVATFDGPHAVLGNVSLTRLRIDGDGAIVYLDDYGFPADPTRVIRAPLMPASAEILYNEASAPMRVDPTHAPFVYVHEADLFTGP